MFVFDEKAQPIGRFQRVGPNFFLEEQLDDAEFEVEQGAVREQRFASGVGIHSEKPPQITDIVRSRRVEPKSDERLTFATRPHRILAGNLFSTLAQINDEIFAISRFEPRFLRERENVLI